MKSMRVIIVTLLLTVFSGCCFFPGEGGHREGGGREGGEHMGGERHGGGHR